VSGGKDLGRALQEAGERLTKAEYEFYSAFKRWQRLKNIKEKGGKGYARPDRYKRFDGWKTRAMSPSREPEKFTEEEMQRIQ